MKTVKCKSCGQISTWYFLEWLICLCGSEEYEIIEDNGLIVTSFLRKGQNSDPAPDKKIILWDEV